MVAKNRKKEESFEIYTVQDHYSMANEKHIQLKCIDNCF